MPTEEYSISNIGKGIELCLENAMSLSNSAYTLVTVSERVLSEDTISYVRVLSPEENQKSHSFILGEREKVSNEPKIRIAKSDCYDAPTRWIGSRIRQDFA